MSQGSFFPEVDDQKARKTRAPEQLNPAQMKHLERWAEATVPWIARGALGSVLPLEWHIAETLEYWRSTGTLRPDWVATIQVRIRQVEHRRLAQLGTESAKLALRSPLEWARGFDRLARLKPQNLETEQSLPRPSGGKLIHLRKE